MHRRKVSLLIRRPFWWLMVLGFSYHTSVGIVVSLQHQQWVWRSSSEQGERRHKQATQYEFLSFADAHIHDTAAVLYVTPDSQASIWTYYQLSYKLYPAPVWWITPAKRTSPVDWWLESALTTQALTELAARKGARYLILDGVNVSSDLRFCALFEFDAERSIVVFP
ncbi:MAG: hypothetical protein ISS56_01135 [Anaerolineae bacterium]|nr:hypothetical protein [Anaerolineae bacterium]